MSSTRLVTRTIPADVYAEQWKVDELKEEVQRLLGLDLPVEEWAKEEGIADEEIKTRLNDAADRLFAQRAAQYGTEVWRQVEKSVLMQLFDQSWKEHLLHLDHLRQGIGLRAYGQKDPLNEYKREAFNLFSDLLTGLREQVVGLLATLQLRMETPPPMPVPPMQMQMHEVHEDPALAAALRDDPAFDPADPDGGGVATLHRPKAAAQRPPRLRAIPTIRGPGARSRATRPAPAARAGSTSTATGGCERGRHAFAMVNVLASQSCSIPRFPMSCRWKAAPISATSAATAPPRAGLVRRGAVFRSAHLGNLTDEDRGALAQLGVRTIVDLRGVNEAAETPHRDRRRRVPHRRRPYRARRGRAGSAAPSPTAAPTRIS